MLHPRHALHRPSTEGKEIGLEILFDENEIRNGSSIHEGEKIQKKVPDFIVQLHIALAGVQFDDAFANSHDGSLGTIVRMKFVENIPDMIFDGFLAKI